MNLRRLVSIALVSGPILLWLTGCPDDATGIARAALTQGCTLNSDCEAPLVCAYKRCHRQCDTSRDCAPGQRCIVGDRPEHVCQLPEEKNCSRNADCPGAQVCGIDGQCRDGCRTDRDCISEQTCAQGQCAEALETASVTIRGGNLGEPCTWASECSGTLVCLRGRCDLECVADRDCFVTWTCTNTRCTPPGTPRCPARVDGGDYGGVISAAAGEGHTCAVRTAEDVFCWGSNSSGQLGRGNVDALAHTDVLAVAAAGPAIQVAAGAQFSCALKKDGTVACWGDDTRGQLGRGITDAGGGPSGTPAAVPGLTGITQIAAGEQHACALAAGGTLYCWGANDAGQLGRGSMDAQPHGDAMAVAALGTDVAEIGLFGQSTCARLKNGSLSCWGDNGAGQLGAGTIGAPVSTPGPALVLTAGVTALGHGPLARHACAVMAGTLYCWGEGSDGQLGDGLAQSTGTPAPVAALGTTVVKATTGARFTCAALTNGAAWCWGPNDRGMLGDGTSQPSTVPVQVASLGARASRVLAGLDHACVIQKDALLLCWGANDLGALADGTIVDSPIPVLSAVPCPGGP